MRGILLRLIKRGPINPLKRHAVPDIKKEWRVRIAC
jgi:hypothetical protein